MHKTTTSTGEQHPGHLYMHVSYEGRGCFLRHAALELELATLDRLSIIMIEHRNGHRPSTVHGGLASSKIIPRH